MTYSCRFIFVHFNAWEYVGSDILWAGIVTNLSRAIEAEFGVMTSRIFRLLNVDVIHSDARSNERTLFIDVTGRKNDEEFEEILKEYGVVKRCENSNEVWVVEYSDSAEAAHAYEAMTSNGIKVTMHRPKNETARKGSCTRADYAHCFVTSPSIL